MERQDHLTRGYARLSGLRRHCDAQGASQDLAGVAMFMDSYVQEFHEALEHLAKCGFDVVEFKVRSEHMMGRYVDRALLLAKLDAVLAYFEITTPKAKDPSGPGFHVGFHAKIR